MIEAKYQMQAAKAADAMREALLAVENCGADIELTNIVSRLADDRTKLCRLFGLPAEQAFQGDTLALADLRTEVAQVVICAMALAEAAGFDLNEAVADEWSALGDYS